ncbi:hypothetical protein FisN_32Lh056 [Fistulifera solaris]|uniref:Transcription initiation factor TFIID subunit 9B n=1 Tax=Fistulifera solaris TaxID=1519565 RepID=A0A1Z5JGA6_FISSO|nr:hypothetical protein FisN_32Lh056 [Fistulifera solaris]|eukprot:GAX12922.1 hypothetical protein FisN_32Lh056 [Fistulifera solaris]
MTSNPSTASQPMPSAATAPPTANAPPATATTNAPAPSAPTAKSKSGSTKTKTVTKASGAAGTQAKVKKPASRKKPVATNPNNNNNKNTTTPTALQQAKLAQADLAKQRAQAEARKMDPLWYRIEDVLWDTSAAIQNSSILPEQVPLVEQVLSHYGLTTADVTPQAMTCLLEQARRFAQELMGHAHDLAFAANRIDIQEGDLKLAVQLRPDFRIATTAQIPKLHQVAQHINRMPLPPIPSHCFSGVVLPPAPYQLTARTYDIVSGAKVQRKISLAVPAAPPKPKSTYGATKGRQIPIQLKSTVVEESSPAKMDVTAVEPATTNPSTTNPVDVAIQDVPTVEGKNERPSSQDPVPMETSITAEESTITTAAEVTTTDPAAAAATTTQEATLHPQPEEATAKIEEVQRSDVVMKEEEKATPMDTTGAISEPSKEEEKPSNATNE